MGLIVQHNGTKEWYEEEKLQKIEYMNGEVRWYSNDLLHREGGPAVQYPDGGEMWYIQGQLHRDGDLPAVVYSSGEKRWYNQGQLHRDGDLPAVEACNGTKEWYIRGNRHRDGDLPAVEYADGWVEWWVDGVKGHGIQTETALPTTHRCMIYNKVPSPGQRYRICSIFEHHVFIQNGMEHFRTDRCLRCSNPLETKTFIQP